MIPVTPLAEQHIQANLACLDVLLRREVARFRLEHGTRPDEEFRGLYVSDDDVERLLNERPQPQSVQQTQPQDSTLQAFDNDLDALERRVASIEEVACRENVMLPLQRVAGLLDLDSFERRVVVIGLAAEVNIKYERLFEYLQDDVTKKRPTVALVNSLLCQPTASSLALRRYFEPESKLLRWQIISLHDDPGARKPVLLARYLKLDERIVSYLLGTSASDARLPVNRIPEITKGQQLVPELYQQLAVWGSHWGSWQDKSPVVLFHGRYGTEAHGSGCSWPAAGQACAHAVYRQNGH